jgi:hypothetical protein
MGLLPDPTIFPQFPGPQFPGTPPLLPPASPPLDLMIAVLYLLGKLIS